MEEQAVEIPLSFAGDKAHWTITLENGEQSTGEIETSEETVLTLPKDLPLGYHRLTLKTDNTEENCSLIITPAKAFQPAPLEQQKKLWGAFL